MLKLAVLALFVVAAVDAAHVFTFDRIDPGCMVAAPVDDANCRAQTIWTFDFKHTRCVQTTGCYADHGPEFNVFPSEIGCNMYCSMNYE